MLYVDNGNIKIIQKDVVYVTWIAGRTLLKHITLIRMKYPINAFYAKHQEMHLLLIFMHIKIVWKSTLKKYLDSVEKLLQTFNDVERKEAEASEVQIDVNELC